MSRTKTAFKCLLAIFMIGAGTMHFLSPQFYMTIMPPYLPFHLELVYLSGFFEFTLGVLLLVPRFSRLAAWGIFALLIAVFPANLYMAVAPIKFGGFLDHPLYHWIRIPLQGVLMVWVLWCTR